MSKKMLLMIAVIITTMVPLYATFFPAPPAGGVHTIGCILIYRNDRSQLCTQLSFGGERRCRSQEDMVSYLENQNIDWHDLRVIKQL